MNHVNATSLILIAIFFSQAAFAATVFTRDSRADGSLKRQNEKEIVLQPKDGAEIIIPRDQALTLHDDEGTLLWSHPSIVQNDPTPENTTRIEIPAADSGGPYRGMHVGLGGSFGMLWPSSLFSNFPYGTSQAYDYLFEITALGAWYYANDRAVTFGLGYARRNVPIAGILESGITADGHWPMDYLDVRVGYRTHSGIFFLEPGLLAAINMTHAPLTVATSTGTLTNGNYGTPAYLALSFAFGAQFLITRQIFALCAIRAEHALTAAVAGNAPTASDVNGNALSTAPIHLVPFNIAVQLGATWRLDLPAPW